MAVPEFGGYVLEGMQIFRKFDPMYQGFAGITGGQIYRFRESRKYCGRCGHRMEYSQTERAMVCPGLQADGIPKDQPGGDRGHHQRGQAFDVPLRPWAPTAISRLIAGYVEVGGNF